MIPSASGYRKLPGLVDPLPRTLRWTGKQRANAMKLLRYGPAGEEKPGMLDSAGQIRSLSGVIDDVAGAALSAA